jgi:hypothetical protein
VGFNIYNAIFIFAIRMFFQFLFDAGFNGKRKTIGHKWILLKQASNKQELSNKENILTVKTKILVKISIPASRISKKFILNLVESSRWAPSRNQQLQQLVLCWKWRKPPQEVIYCVTKWSLSDRSATQLVLVSDKTLIWEINYRP